MPFVHQVRLHDRDGVSKHASPEAFASMLSKARIAAAMAAEEVAWLEVQLARRCAEVATRQWPPDLAANGDLVSPAIASLCEIVTEVTVAVSQLRGDDSREFVDVVRRSLKEHAHSLGFEFQGIPPGGDAGGRPNA